LELPKARSPQSIPATAINRKLPPPFREASISPLQTRIDSGAALFFLFRLKPSIAQKANRQLANNYIILIFWHQRPPALAQKTITLTWQN
jgi:hypothetical protein